MTLSIKPLDIILESEKIKCMLNIDEVNKIILDFQKQNKSLVFLYNVRHSYPNPDDLNTYLDTDYDDPKTIETILNYLKKLNFNVLPLEATSDIKQKLIDNKDQIGLVLNYSEAIIEGDRKKQITSVCEELNIPFTGSSDYVQVLIRNKADAKVEMRKFNIPVLPDQTFKDPSEPLLNNLTFPLIVKPIGQGSSAGITNKSVVKNEEQLRTQLNEVIKNFKDSAIVEPFITGQEFSVGMVGNPPKILPIIEPNMNTLPKGYEPIDSLEVKWLYEEQVTDHLTCPAEVDPTLKTIIEETALLVWNSLKIKDLCRIDMRCDKEGNLFVLEVNSPPGLLPPEISTTSYFPLAARTIGIEYGDLLKTIIASALQRYK